MSFKKGNKIRCINAATPYSSKLVEGEIYTVQDNSSNQKWVLVEELSTEGYFFTNRFELVDKPVLGSGGGDEYYTIDGKRFDSHLDAVKYLVSAFRIKGLTIDVSYTKSSYHETIEYL